MLFALYAGNGLDFKALAEKISEEVVVSDRLLEFSAGETQQCDVIRFVDVDYFFEEIHYGCHEAVLRALGKLRSSFGCEDTCINVTLTRFSMARFVSLIKFSYC